jgi:tetratricopeptide (TPR) repeat protein
VVGWCHTQLGEYSKARDCCLEGLELCRAMGNRTGEAATLDSLAEAHHHLGEHAEAAHFHRQAVDLRLEFKHYQHAAASLTRLGETRIAVGGPETARRAWAEALAILDGLEHPDAGALRARLRELHGQA